MAVVALAGCSSNDSGLEPGRTTVVVDAYPTAYAAEQVLGDDIAVVTLTKPGVEPHDLELTAEQVRQVADADVVAYIPGLAPAVEQAAKREAGDRSVNVAAGVDLRPGDPHIWLNPLNMATMGENIAQAVTDQGLADVTGAALTEQMTDLDESFRTQLRPCRIRTFIVSHAAFGYLGDAYGLTQQGVAGNSPEAEPSPARLKELSALIRAQGITTLYTEPLAPPAAVDVLAAETGTTTAVLDPVESATGGLTYLQLMRANLKNLHDGQDCG